MDQRDDGTRDGTGADLAERAEAQRDSRLRSLIAQQAALASRLAATQQAGPHQDLYRSFGDSFTRAVEMAVTPVLFGAMGYGLDRWLDTRPILMTIFFLVAIIGMLLRTWYGYTYRMQALEQAQPWSSKAPAEPAEAQQV